MTGNTRRTLALVGGAVMVASVAVLGTLYATGAFAFQENQEDVRRQQVAEKGSGVMPFDLEATTHVYEKTENGGVQKVVADDPDDAGNVAAIREHLREEADAFGRGEFSDPASIHGRDMPGLAELEAGAGRVEVSYEDLPDGAQIVLESEDPELVAAVHEWFDAQISDHGDDATEAVGQGEGMDASEHEEHH
ncbi:MAG: aspartate carbamoyltransferase [Rubrobacteraceae bacterium]